MPNIGGIASSIIRVISDTFTRTVSGSLGNASGGAQRAWSTLAGTWYANGSSARSDDAGSSYARAYQLLYPSATISADVSGGVGISFWGQDANNWWAAYPNYIQNTSTSTTCTGPTTSWPSTDPTPANSCGTISSSSTSTCTGPTVTCDFPENGTCVPSGSCGTITYTPVVYSAYYSAEDGPCNLSGGTSVACSNCGMTGNAGGCTTTPGLPYCCYFPSRTVYVGSSASYVTTTTTSSATLASTTTYSYDTQIKVISSVSGSITTSSTTTLVSGAGSLNTVGSLKVVTSGSTATTTAYSGTGLVSQLGSPIVSSPTSPSTGPFVGILKATSTYNQGSTLDNFSATA